jgi:hypothetical protein
MNHCASWFRSRGQKLALMLSLSVIAAGCGGDKVDKSKGVSKPRVGAAGKVDYDGKPLEAGTIGFTNKDTGNSMSAVITNGEFNLKAEEGPNPGENNVLVTGKEKADGPILWTWNSKVDIPEGGLTAGAFAVDSKKTKKAPKPNPDD